MYSSIPSLDYLDRPCHNMSACHVRDGFKIHNQYKEGPFISYEFHIETVDIACI